MASIGATCNEGRRKAGGVCPDALHVTPEGEWCPARWRLSPEHTAYCANAGHRRPDFARCIRVANTPTLRPAWGNGAGWGCGLIFAMGGILMECRAGCGACCIAPSISSPLPGMPHGKPAGVRCLHLTTDNRCALYGRPERPEVCRLFQASLETCGHTRRQAIIYLTALERATRPDRA